MNIYLGLSDRTLETMRREWLEFLKSTVAESQLYPRDENLIIRARQLLDQIDDVSKEMAARQ